jgi:hypothetical protein
MRLEVLLFLWLASSWVDPVRFAYLGRILVGFEIVRILPGWMPRFAMLVVLSHLLQIDPPVHVPSH